MKILHVEVNETFEGCECKIQLKTSFKTIKAEEAVKYILVTNAEKREAKSKDFQIMTSI